MELSLTDAEEILGEYELGRGRSLQRIGSGYANENYRLVTGRGEFLLRLYNEKTEYDVSYEMRVLGRLKKTHFPAAYPIQRRDGGCISRHKDRMTVIYEFIRGREPDRNERTVEEIATAVARLNCMKGWEDLKKENALNFNLCTTVISRYEGAPNRYPDIFEYFSRETEYLKNALEEENLPWGLIHGDVFSDNTIFLGNELHAIIDWEEVCTDRLLIDVGVTVNGFCFVRNRLDEKLMHRFLNGYESIRKLTKKEHELLPYFIRWGAHCMIAWHLNRLIYRMDERKIERVMMFMERLKRLPRE